MIGTIIGGAALALGDELLGRRSRRRRRRNGGGIPDGPSFDPRAGLMPVSNADMHPAIAYGPNYGPQPPATSPSRLETTEGGKTYVWDEKKGMWVLKRRRRRRKLLTASDKADIAFLTGVLGKGQTGSAAISALLSRRV